MPTGLLIGAAIGGLGLMGYGTAKNISASKQANAAQQQMIAQQQQQDAIRQRAMELDAKRRNMENFRQMQRQRSLALSTATNQGAFFGSGLQGGYGQISGQGNWNALGIDQNLGLGQQMFASKGIENQYKMNYASAQSQSAIGSGLTSLGGALLSSAGTLNSLGKQAFGGNSNSTAGQPLSLDYRNYR